MEEFEQKHLGIGYREGITLVPNPRRPLNRIMVGIPTTGLIRMEWALARWGQVIPCNWSQVDTLQWLDQNTPIDYLVADARNIIVHHCLEQGFEWLFFVDHDVILPPGTIIKLNERMMENKVPVWSGLYFTKSVPSEPLVYRGNGVGYHRDWTLGEEVWCSALPMGCTMIHSSILRELAKISEEYEVSQGMIVRRVFHTPARTWYDPERMSWFNATGTEDIEWCWRVIEEGILGKAGWSEYADKEFPFLIDTSIFCSHIEQDGKQYPSRGEAEEFIPKEVSDGSNSNT